MQMPFLFNIGIHKCYLGKTGGAGYLCMLGFIFTFYLIVSLAQAEVEAEMKSKKISNDQELIQSDPTSCPQNQKGNN